MVIKDFTLEQKNIHPKCKFYLGADRLIFLSHLNKWHIFNCLYHITVNVKCLYLQYHITKASFLIHQSFNKTFNSRKKEKSSVREAEKPVSPQQMTMY